MSVQVETEHPAMWKISLNLARKMCLHHYWIPGDTAGLRRVWAQCKRSRVAPRTYVPEVTADK